MNLLARSHFKFLSPGMKRIVDAQLMLTWVDINHHRLTALDETQLFPVKRNLDPSRKMIAFILVRETQLTFGSGSRGV